ncbi:MAG: heavy metal translocating P-type ATPase [Chitinophagales bacterium]
MLRASAVLRWLRREQLLWRTVVCAVLVAASFFKLRLFGVDPGLIAALLGGYPYFWTALKGLRRLDTSVGFLVSVATIAALAIGEYYAAGHVVLIMLIGELIEERTLRRTSRSFTELLQLFPERATVRRAGQEVVVRPEEVQPGELVLVRGGERIPVDGVVTGGEAAVDQRHVTGESVPAQAGPGAEVFAGSVATDGYLEVEARETGGATSLAGMVRLLHEAQTRKAPVVKLADRFTRWFSPAVLLIAGLVYFLTDDLIRSLTILVVACPCALCVATPTAIAAGIGAGARRGLLIKAGGAVEALGRVDAVLFDKTGTLTLGELRLAKVLPAPGEARSRAELLAIAAAAEGGSPHPVAEALRREAKAAGEERPELQLTGFRSLPGGGVAAKVDGVDVVVGPRAVLAQAGVAGAEDLWQEAAAGGAVTCGLAIDGRLAAVLALVDGPRPELGSLMDDLRAAGIEWLEMVTGDRAEVAASVAEGLGLDRVGADLRPEDKVARVQELKAAGRRVAVVGDGVNDAPALAASDVGLAMGGRGTALAAEAAEVVLGGDALERLPEAVQLGRRVLRTIRQNLTLSVLVNTVAIGLSAAGLIRPIGGAIIHNAGSVAVVLNSAALLGFRPRRTEKGRTAGRRDRGTGRRTNGRANGRGVVAAGAPLFAIALAVVGGLGRPAEAHILPLVRNLRLEVGSLTDLGPLTPYTLPKGARGEQALSALFLVYDTLFIRDGEGAVRSWVAAQSSWRGDRVLELTLAPKEKVQWHDTGEAVTAEDVAATFAVFQRWPHPLFTPVAKRVQRVETVGAGRVRLVLAEADEQFPARLAQLPLLPAHLWQKVTEPAQVREAVGCGPFRLTEYRPGQGYQFTGVEGYYLAEHRAAALDLVAAKDEAALADLLFDGKLHVTLAPLSSETARRFEATLPRLRGFRLRPAPGGAYVYRATVFSDWHWTDDGPVNRLSLLKLPALER